MSAAEKALALLNGLRDAVTNLPVRGADPRLAKTFLRVSDCIFELEQWCMESTALEDRALIAACAPYLKDGETPAECIARNRADIDSVLTLLAQAKQSVQHLATCATNGHVYGRAGACIFCGEPKSTPVEPAGASEPPKWIPTEGCNCYLCREARRPAPVSPVAPEPPTYTDKELACRGCMGPCGRCDELSAPTGAPAPCVWRVSNPGWMLKPHCRELTGYQASDAKGWTHCPYCGHPLTVER